MDDDKSTSQPIDEEEKLEESASPEEAVQEEVQEEVEEVTETEDVEEQGEEEAPSTPSRRENLRIQQLIQKLKQQPEQPKPKNNNPIDGLNYKTTLDADDETIETLEKDRQNWGESQYNQGVNQATELANSNIFHTRLEIDAPKVHQKYKFLDSEANEFDPQIAQAVNDWYLASTGYDSSRNTVQNSDIRYYDFVDSIFELADEIATRKIQSTTRNIAKQAASTGIRPDGSRTKKLNLNQAPADMTDEELEAIISSSLPK